MSSSTSPVIEYNCSNSCSIYGCPSHKLTVSHSRTSDTVIVAIDGKPKHYFDSSAWYAMLHAHDMLGMDTDR